MTSFPRLVQALARILIALVAVGVLATSATATAGSGPARFELTQSPAEEGRACVMANDAAATVVCGGEFLQRFVDPGRLIMAKDTCALLLEELFADSVCILGRDQCGQFQPAAPPLPSYAGLVTSPPPTLVHKTPKLESSRVGSLFHAANERLPPSWSSRPPSPPPRA